MSKIATAKQTGQGGTSYEDKIVAYFLVCMLSETLPFDPLSGLIKKISLQVGADGWLFEETAQPLIKTVSKHTTPIVGPE